MSLKHCSECGQALPKERREDPGTCERCERAKRAEQLEERVAELEAAEAHAEQLETRVEELQEQLEGQESLSDSELEERIVELLSLGLSPSQVLDVIFTQELGYSVSKWANRRNVTKPAVYNNLSSADPLIEEQTQLAEFARRELEETAGEREQRVEEINQEAARDAMGGPDPRGFQ